MASSPSRSFNRRDRAGSYFALNDETELPLPSGSRSPALEPGLDEKEGSSFLPTPSTQTFDRTPSESHDGQGMNPRHFSRRTQFMRLLWYPILPRWVLSIVLCILISGHLKTAQKVEMGAEGRNQWWFASVLVLLVILLAMNLKSAGGEAYDMARWRILSSKAHSQVEAEAVLASGRGFGAAWRATWVSMRKSKPFSSLGLVVGPCVLMVTVLCVGFTGFLYTFNIRHGTGLEQGSFAKAELKLVNYGTPNEKPSDDMKYFLAHLYGDMSYTDVDGLPNLPMWAGEPALIETSGKSSDEQNWIYKFRDSNMEGSQWRTSGRSVKVAAKCKHYPIVEGQMGNSDSITYLNGTSRTVLYNLQKFAPGATVWVNARSDVSPWSFCGTRCARVFALQFLNAGEDEKKAQGDMFDCEVSVSGVEGGQPDDQIPDDIAAIFAGSIGLRGFISTNDKWQYTRYSRDMFWGEEMGNNATAAAYKASRFAVGALAIADVFGPRKEEVGHVPSGPDGMVLVVYWTRVFIALSGLLGLHLALALIALSYANSIVIPSSSSSYDTKRLLRRVGEGTLAGERYRYGI